MSTPRRTARAKPATRGRSPTLTIPAPEELLTAIDAYAQHLSKQRLGVHVSRAQAVREILIATLAAWRDAQARDAPSPPPEPAPGRSRG